MKNKHNLKTVRLSTRDSALVDRFLESNIAIENFSSLARIAILDLIAKRGSIPLKPIVEEDHDVKPSFIWEYDLSDNGVREILTQPLEKRKWLVAKILKHARFDEVWKYLSPRDIERDLPSLRLPQKTKDHWAYAIKRWKEASWKS